MPALGEERLNLASPITRRTTAVRARARRTWRVPVVLSESPRRHPLDGWR
ncbi:MAG: hypothetical protein MZV65_53075 [Chromatiales bacterium]|nr:hypothetical protein [Chromatiales bacterium]